MWWVKETDCITSLNFVKTFVSKDGLHLNFISLKDKFYASVEFNVRVKGLESVDTLR